MADRIVLLSGEHPTLPVAELQALLAVHDPAARILSLSPSTFRVQSAATDAVDKAVSRMALAHAWSDYWVHTAGGEEGLARVHEHVRDTATGQGSIAVRASRSGADRSVSRAGIERTLGTVLAAAGHRVDLERPDDTITAWIHGDGLVVGHRIGEVDRSRFETRAMEERDHFSPIGLHPRRALSLIHLARVPPGGRIYDPFCGTGGLVLEAALDGYDAWGSDIDPWMVQGTLSTLADGGPEALPGQAFVADIGDAPDLIEDVDGIVTDLPYGKASSTDGEGLETLYDRAFSAFMDILAPGGLAVFGCAADVSAQARRAGLRIDEHHEEFVHRSLTRHYFVARRP